MCRVVIPLLTTYWLSSKWCFAEIVQARSSGKTILPLKVAECDAQGVLPAIQQIDLKRYPQEGYKRLELAPRDVFPWDASRPPYPGLTAFQEDQAAIFFGRDPEISEGIKLLESLRAKVQRPPLRPRSGRVWKRQILIGPRRQASVAAEIRCE